jgi:hypothetical protein
MHNVFFPLSLQNNLINCAFDSFDFVVLVFLFFGFVLQVVGCSQFFNVYLSLIFNLLVTLAVDKRKSCSQVGVTYTR